MVAVGRKTFGSSLAVALCALLAGALHAANCGVVELDFNEDDKLESSKDDDILVVMATRHDMNGGTTSAANLYARLVNRKVTQQIATGSTDIKNIDVRLVDDTNTDTDDIWIAYEDGGIVYKVKIRATSSGGGVGNGSISVASGPTAVNFTAVDLDGDGTNDTVTHHHPAIEADSGTSPIVVAEAYGTWSSDSKRAGWTIAANGQLAIDYAQLNVVSGAVDYAGTALGNLVLGHKRRPSISEDGLFVVFEAEVPESVDGTAATLINGGQYGNDPEGYVYNVVGFPVSSGANGANVIVSTVDIGGVNPLPANNMPCTHPRIAVSDPSGSPIYTITWQSREHHVDHYDSVNSVELDSLPVDKFGNSDAYRWVGTGLGSGTTYRMTAADDAAYTHPVASADGRRIAVLRLRHVKGTYGYNILHIHDADSDYYNSTGDNLEALCIGPLGGEMQDKVHPPAIGQMGVAVVVHTRANAGHVDSGMSPVNDTDPDNPNDTNAVEDFMVVDTSGQLLYDYPASSNKRAMLASRPDGL